MKVFFITLMYLLFSYPIFAQKEDKIATIYIDKDGVMRWSDSHSEASFYGVNYTLPFAHAYRAMNYLGKDHKEAIDRDVYHLSRLGFNAYRIHVWDVEISDAKGQLLENEHLNLLDYLISKLKERNIRILITTMTNFGNGYPERNQNTGAFTYLYDKCQIHNNPEAIAAQENYIGQLVKHLNPYTKQSYKDDPFIIGFEINNEPCHSGTPAQTEEYINKMLAALKKAGNKKPVFYNVSHNMSHTEAYYKTDIQGTTYQWYPIGLVAGHTRKGNFLPYVDQYDIPFSNLKNFDKKAKAVYEFDPADITYSYMYPAMARTFRSEGFQWITQFAYDPIDMAWANTEYQTHFLNLAYTPNKVISMKIAAEVAYSIPRNQKFNTYPQDTIFDKFQVSYLQDLSVLNSGDKFFYSNNTISKPIAPEQLKSIAGCGSSPIVSYEGTGAYFIDQLEDGVWRLEVMPDAVQIQDPFEKPSLDKEVVTIAWNEWNMNIKLSQLGENFKVAAINRGNTFNKTSNGTSIAIKPGVYLLTQANYTPKNQWSANTKWNNITLGEYVAPEARAKIFSVVHHPDKVIEADKSLQIEANIVGPAFPDSVIIYTDKVSFWSDKNPYIKMNRTHGYTYQATIPAVMIGEGVFRYNIIVCEGSKNYTFPADIEGNPLDWNFYQSKYYESRVVAPTSPIELVKITDEYSGIEAYGVPETSYIIRKLNLSNLTESNSLNFNFKIKDSDARFFWRKYIRDYVSTRRESLQQAQYVCVDIKKAEGIDNLKIGFVTSNGFTYTSKVSLNDKGVIRVRLSDLKQGVTTLLPSPYPTFLEQTFIPDTQIPFKIGDIEMLQISTTNNITEKANIELGSVWIE